MTDMKVILDQAIAGMLVATILSIPYIYGCAMRWVLRRYYEVWQRIRSEIQKLTPCTSFQIPQDQIIEATGLARWLVLHALRREKRFRVALAV